MTKADIVLMQHRIQSGVAPPGISRRPKKQKHRTEMAKCTRPPHNPARGTLRKRMKRLERRRHGAQDVCKNPGYRMPGSMTK